MLFDGKIGTPRHGLEAITSEQHCAVFVVGIGVDRTKLGVGIGPALNLLAPKGILAGGTVEVIGILGLNTVSDMEAATFDAQPQRRQLGLAEYKAERRALSCLSWVR